MLCSILDHAQSVACYMLLVLTELCRTRVGTRSEPSIGTKRPLTASPRHVSGEQRRAEPAEGAERVRSKPTDERTDGSGRGFKEPSSHGHRVWLFGPLGLQFWLFGWF